MNKNLIYLKVYLIITIIMTDLELEQSQLIDKLQLEIKELKERLKKYTNPERNKKYYENNKDMIIMRNNSRPSLTSEQRRIYNKNYYEKKKAKKNV